VDVGGVPLGVAVNVAVGPAGSVPVGVGSTGVEVGASVPVGEGSIGVEVGASVPVGEGSIGVEVGKSVGVWVAHEQQPEAAMLPGGRQTASSPQVGFCIQRPHVPLLQPARIVGHGVH
jgi:hypothetical protein